MVKSKGAWGERWAQRGAAFSLGQLAGRELRHHGAVARAEGVSEALGPAEGEGPQEGKTRKQLFSRASAWVRRIARTHHPATREQSAGPSRALNDTEEVQR